MTSNTTQVPVPNHRVTRLRISPMRLLASLLVLACVAILAFVPSAVAMKANAQVLAHLGMSHSTFMSAVQQLQEQRAVAEEGKLPQCGGLVAEMCKPCPAGGPEGFCKAMEEECGRIFCNPMCKRNTWTCSVTFGSLKTESANHKKYEDALCVNFINEACSTMIDCCPKDSYLFSEVEEKVYGNEFPTPRLPSPSCIHNPASAAAGSQLCSNCKGQVKVKLEKLKCKYPISPGAFLETASELTSEADLSADEPAPAAAAAKGAGEGRALYEKLYSGLVHGNGAMPLEDLYAADEALLGAIDAHGEPSEAAALLELHSSATVAGDDEGGRFGKPPEGFPGEAAYKGLQERCEAIEERIEQLFGDMQTTFQEASCHCLGCCAKQGEPVCFFPMTVTISGPPSAKGGGISYKGATGGSALEAGATVTAAVETAAKTTVTAKATAETAAKTAATAETKTEAAAETESDADEDADAEGEMDLDSEADADEEADEEVDDVAFLQMAIQMARAKLAAPRQQSPQELILSQTPRLWRERARRSPWYEHIMQKRAAAAAAQQN